MKDVIQTLIDAALHAAAPALAVERHWVPMEGPVYLLATGKASLEMAARAVQLIPNLAAGLVTAVPERMEMVGGGVTLADPRVTVLPADHPLPTERNIAAAKAALEFVSKVPQDATLLVLASGGGSAHLTLPAGDVTLEDLREITRTLQRAGATIDDLNAVRKHCERLKGGRLAAACPAGRIVSMVMSDVEGDRLDVIASGPTAADPTTYADALKVLEQYSATGICARVAEHLREGAAGKHKETLKPGDKSLLRVEHRVIASNRTVQDAVADAARLAGLFVARDHRFISGGAAAEGRRIGSTLRRLSTTSSHPVVFIAGGEPVVNVGAEHGLGGPSQELALAAAVELDDAEGITLAAVSTDGVDGPPGPTPQATHAGAIVNGETAQSGRGRGLDPVDHLNRHDSATYFATLGGAIRTGPTGTNLNHVVIGILTPPKR